MFKNKNYKSILNDFDNNKNSHSYIFYTNDFFACKEDVYNLVKNIFKVDNIDLISSDFLVVKQSNNKNILKDDIVNIKDMFYNTSYLNNKRIYLIEEAHKLNSTSANIILKFLEEPLDGIVAFFITTNLDAVLTTIKSRCQIINCFYNDINISFDNDSILDDIFSYNQFVAIWTLKEKLKKYDRNMLIDLFNNYLIKCYNNIDNDFSLKKIKLLNKVISMLSNNVNIDYVFDYLFLEGSE